MAKFQNNRPFMTSSEESERQPGDINPEHIANALMREAIQNARSSGNDIRKTLINKVGLPIWMVDIAAKIDHSALEVWQRYLKHGRLTHARGVTLAQVEMLLKIKQYISEELMTAPDENETKHNNFKCTIETAVARVSEHPKKSKNQNFTPEKGSDTAPEYDGKDDTDDVQGNLWVFPTRITQWTVVGEKPDGTPEFGPGETIAKIDELRQLYMDRMRQGDASGIPIHHLKYEVKDWVRHWKPSLQETYARPDQERRDEIEFYKRREIRKLREATGSSFWKIAFKYLKKLARVDIEDLSREKRIENQIRRKFNNRKLRVEGKTYLPPMAAGDMLQPMLEERVKLLVSKNPKLDDQLPWAIEVYFDAEAREELDGEKKVTAGVPILLNRYRNQQNDD